jgi:aldehyde dehydrogenase (NAD+)
MEKKLEELNCELRTTFKQGSTRPIQWRLSQLGALASMLRLHRDEIHRALQEDLGKSPFESFVTEVARKP